MATDEIRDVLKGMGLVEIRDLGTLQARVRATQRTFQRITCLGLPLDSPLILVRRMALQVATALLNLEVTTFHISEHPNTGVFVGRTIIYFEGC
jgi:hypothetical protein